MLNFNLQSTSLTPLFTAIFISSVLAIVFFFVVRRNLKNLVQRSDLKNPKRSDLGAKFFAQQFFAIINFIKNLPLIHSIILAERKKELNKELTNIIDLLRLQILAGLGLESSFSLMAKNVRGAWGVELKKINLYLNSGFGIKEALSMVDKDLGINDFHNFILALKQAQFLGISLNETLLLQSNLIKTRRRQRIDEQIRLASVKISIPLVLFIFPSLLIIYLAPAILQILKII